MAFTSLKVRSAERSSRGNCAEQEERSSGLDKRLDLRQCLSVDADGSHCHDVDSVMQRWPGKQFLRPNSVDRRSIEVKSAHNFP